MTEAYTYNLGLAYYETVKTHGARIALRFPSGETVSHEALNKLSNRFANVLASSNISRGDVVAIFSAKSTHAIACMIGCLKIGAIYTNLDVSSPDDRIKKMLATCDPRLIFVDEGVNVNLDCAPQGCQVRFGNAELLAQIDQASDVNLEVSKAVTGTDPAYIMFTSGSTGFPKGAVMTHANVLNFIDWGRVTVEVGPDDVFTNVNPMYFDNSVFDFYVSIFNGASLCPIGADLVRRGRALVQCLGALGCTVWFSVPSMLVYLLNTRAISAGDFPDMRAIVFGGEGFPKPKLKELHDFFGTRTRLVNVYGPTECTCICSSYEIDESDFDDMGELAPLGDIAPNFGVYIEPIDNIDPDLGELWLYGPNVGLGYYNDADRTSKSFVQDPGGPGYQRRMYRTGDLVQRAKNGWLHFKGRVDNQIKHMGYRIELEEIEAAFSTIRGVDEVGVVYKSQADGPGHIMAYVGTRAELDEKVTLAEIKKIVPPYMVPRQIVFMNELPKNQSGKIDRKRLKEHTQ